MSVSPPVEAKGTKLRKRREGEKLKRRGRLDGGSLCLKQTWKGFEEFKEKGVTGGVREGRDLNGSVLMRVAMGEETI